MAVTARLVRKVQTIRRQVNTLRSRVGASLFSAPAPGGPLTSAVCTEAQLTSPAFRQWLHEMREPFQYHRKLWEWAFIAEALAERGMLRPGVRGLGFAVGTEPLTALFASRGCELVATDLDPAIMTGVQARWLSTNQHASSLQLLNARGICEPEEFARQVTLRYVDMTAVPEDLRGFDFVWSSCSFEHLGSLEAGKRFVDRMTGCLRPGGVAVHTTEYNVLSNGVTVEVGPDVFFRRRDIEEMARRVEVQGCRMLERNYHAGTTNNDWYVAVPPYCGRPHLKLEQGGHVITSIGLIFEKAD